MLNLNNSNSQSASPQSVLGPLDRSSDPFYHYKVIETKHMDQIFHYATSWKEGKVNQMWIQQLTDRECGNLYVAIAYNPEKNVSMVVSKPRTSYQETLQWVKKWCGSFSIVPV